MKAFLVFKEIAPARTHDIRRLAVEAAELEPLFQQYLSCAASLTPYAWEFRYPNDLTETYPSREELDEALAHAQTIYNFVLSLLPAEARP